MVKHYIPDVIAPTWKVPDFEKLTISHALGHIKNYIDEYDSRNSNVIKWTVI